MTSIGSDDRGGLRAMPAEAGLDALLSRAGHRVLAARRLTDLVQGRPSGVTGSQWTSASRASFDFVVYTADTGRPVVAVQIGPVPPPGSAEQRVQRLTDAVSAAVGLPVLRIGSPTLSAAEHGRRLVEYVIDARAYAAGGATAAGTEPQPVGFRDILGRLPDGRTGPVNDLGALTRAAAVEAYVAGQVADPIVRGLHVRWVDGPAQGWSWVQVRPDACLIEQVSVTEHRFSCGIDAARLAEDLAAVAVGERLRENVGVDLLSRAEWTAQIAALSQRRHELVGGFAFDHLCAD
ncbi:hypothetical protein AB0K35_13005 [Micromonospora sp. NPDC053740]|uniref:hypothetical protein n=1 Tax=Micromonospora TaxID=1873 RepID=UPI001EE96A11|nr:hypothetical protein [Micromonospora alfalfae]MCG5466436.1 hypothetical protein [Micromonospora alfalfae]